MDVLEICFASNNGRKRIQKAYLEVYIHDTNGMEWAFLQAVKVTFEWICLCESN